MSRKQANTATKASTSRQTDFSFVRFELEEAELKKLKAWQPTLDEIDSILTKMEEAGYNVAFKYDNFNDCLACYMTTQDKSSPNFNLCLSGRGSTPVKAFKQLAWKHHLCDELWPHPEFSTLTKTEFND